MAEDLIPRPPAEPPPSAAVAPEAAEPAPAQAPQRRAEARPFRYRFGVAYLALAVLAGAAVGSAYLLLGREPKVETRWSAWKPVGDESSLTAQIAEFIGQRYRNTSGTQLVGVIASPPQVQTREGAAPIQWVAIQHEGASSARSNDQNFNVLPAGDGALMYTLCGFGARCSLREGAPSIARGRLLRREALELALYTFKYVDGTDSVIVLMPPNLGDPKDTTDDRQTALFFQRSDFRREVSRPLRTTLLMGQPPRGLRVNAVEQLTIDRLTEPRLFLYDFQPTQAGGWVIVLAPVLNLP